jgi:hypothetical protein
MKRKKELVAILCFATWLMVLGVHAPARGQQAPAAKPNELVVGKLIYVESMQDGLDQWIIDFLRRWGKYKVTTNPEGVDLVIQAVNPDKDLRLETRGGTAEPKGADRPHLPISKKHPELPATSIAVVNWVSSQTVWQADIVNRKVKKDDADVPAGPQTKIFARDMTSDQIAAKVVDKLKEYEQGLEKPSGGK